MPLNLTDPDSKWTVEDYVRLRHNAEIVHRGLLYVSRIHVARNYGNIVGFCKKLLKELESDGRE